MSNLLPGRNYSISVMAVSNGIHSLGMTIAQATSKLRPRFSRRADGHRDGQTDGQDGRTDGFTNSIGDNVQMLNMRKYMLKTANIWTDNINFPKFYQRASIWGKSKILKI